MKYYIPQLPLPLISLTNDLYNEIEKSIIMLTSEGFLIEKETELYKYKIVETKKQNKPIVNYIDDYTLIPANNNNIQHSKIEYIPFIHHTFKKKKSIYKTHHLSQTSFIIEKQDNKIFDFYFESSYDVDNVFLKKDIASLLSYLK